MNASFKELFNGDIRLEYTDTVTGERVVKIFSVATLPCRQESCRGIVTCNDKPVYSGLRQDGSDGQILTSSYDDLLDTIKLEYRRMNTLYRKFSNQGESK